MGPAKAAEEPALLISEVMAANHLHPIEGKLCDWVELYNPGDSPLDLAGYGLSDHAKRPYLYRLSGTLAAKGYLVLTETELGFSLAREGETLYLTAPDGSLVDSLSYANLPPDATYMRGQKASLVTYLPTPGAPNVFQSRLEAQHAQYQTARSHGIIITEIMAANGGFERGKYPFDWVELYNPTDKTLPLAGLFLSTDAASLGQFGFPLGARLKPGSRVIVYCTGSNEKIPGNGVFVNPVFKIEKSNGAIVLSDGQRVIDAVSWDTQFGNVAFGRPLGKGFFQYLNQTTLMQQNPAVGSMVRAPAVTFSVPGGHAQAAFDLSLTAEEGATIHYTLDGSEPGPASPVYDAPLSITRNTVVRAMARVKGQIDSPIKTHTYLFDAPLPGATVCITGERGVFFGGTGMFEQKNENLSAERRANVEIFEEGKEQLNAGAGIRLTGGTSRVFLPRTFSLYARPGLDSRAFQYNPFIDRDYTEYQCLTLRGGGTDANRTRIRDDYLCSLAKGYGIMYLASAPASVYVNGEYWGCMSLRERANKDAIAQWEGITDPALIDQIIIIKNRGIQLKGSREELEALAAFCRNNDLNNPDNLSHVLSQLDVRSLFAHTAMQIICGNEDLQNLRYYKVPGGKWKLLLFDLDLAMLDTRRQPLDFYRGSGRSPTKHFYGELFMSLMRVPHMRDQFITLTGKILSERFSSAYTQPTFDRWQAQYTPLMEKHTTKWTAYSVDSWLKRMGDLRSVIQKRADLIPYYFTQGFSLTQDEVDRFFGDYLKNNPKTE